jgi:hypothetical protein
MVMHVGGCKASGDEAAPGVLHLTHHSPHLVNQHQVDGDLLGSIQWQDSIHIAWINSTRAQVQQTQQHSSGAFITDAGWAGK